MRFGQNDSTKDAMAYAATGVEGLDGILGGGFAANRFYLIEGMPGSGKTTVGLQYLIEGVRRGESSLYMTLSETEEELRAVAASHGWSLEGIHIREVIPSEESLKPEHQYTVFHPSEVELGEATQAILGEMERVKPMRVVFDSLSELRLLAGNPLRYRRQILALKQFFVRCRCTVLVLDDRLASDHDLQVHSIAHGVVQLEQLQPQYGAERRRLRVLKYRGAQFHGGYHDFVIRRGGLTVFPRLVAGEPRHIAAVKRLSSGVTGLDSLLGGGIERGTSTLIAGAAGTGKSSIAAQFVAAAAQRGERAAMFIFDESLNTLLTRTDGLGIPLRRHVDAKNILIQPVDPAELSPGEFIHMVSDAAERQGASIIVIDSLNGYLQAMPDERFLIVQLHELLSYLGQANVATLLVGVHQGLIGGTMTTSIDASYLADAIILLRYFEAFGEVRQALSIVKKRGGAHERTIREFRMGGEGLCVGEPLREFRGVLTGVPVFGGTSDPLMKTQS